MIGAHVYKDNRRGLWVAPVYFNGVFDSGRTRDKLVHVLPRVRAVIPNLTDIVLPPECTTTHREIVLANGFFHQMYDVAQSRTAIRFADDALSRFGSQKAGALELNFEGGGIGGDGNLAQYVTTAVGRVRAKKPNLPIRCNFVGYKGQFIPRDLINEDPQLFVAVQCYGGNMDEQYAPTDVVDEIVAWGTAREKVTPMFPIMCSPSLGKPREVTLMQTRNKGAYYIDDLLIDSGLLPA